MGRVFQLLNWTGRQMCDELGQERHCDGARIELNMASLAVLDFFRQAKRKRLRYRLESRDIVILKPRVKTHVETRVKWREARGLTRVKMDHN